MRKQQFKTFLLLDASACNISTSIFDVMEEIEEMNQKSGPFVCSFADNCLAELLVGDDFVLQKLLDDSNVLFVCIVDNPFVLQGLQLYLKQKQNNWHKLIWVKQQNLFYHALWQNYLPEPNMQTMAIEAHHKYYNLLSNDEEIAEYYFTKTTMLEFNVEEAHAFWQTYQRNFFQIPGLVAKCNSLFEAIALLLAHEKIMHGMDAWKKVLHFAAICYFSTTNTT